MKKLICAIGLLFICHNAFAGTITFGAIAGNWSDATKWVGGVKPVNNDDVLFTVASASCVVNEATANLKSLDMTGYVATLSGAFGINIIGATASTQVCTFAGTITYTGTLTLNPTTSTAVINLTTNAKTLRNVSIGGTAGGDVVLQDNLSFGSVTSASIIIKTDSTLNLNGKTISGNSASNRMIIQSTALGTQNIIVVSGGTFANCDFRDILFNNGGGNLDLSGITGYSGDCGNNGMSGGGALTLSASDTQTWNNADGGVWGGAANWTGTTITRVPLPQDDCVMGIAYNTSKTVTANMVRLGRSIDWTGATYTTQLTWALNQYANTVYGSVNLTDLGALTHTLATTFESQARSGTNTLTSSGLAFAALINFNMAGTAVLALGDAFSTSSRIVCGSLNSLSLGSYTHTFSGSAAATVFTGAGTMDGGTSTIAITDTGANLKTFAGGGKTYYNLSCPTGTGGVSLTGDNTFNDITIAAAGKVKFANNSITSVTSLTATGSAGNSITIYSATATTNHFHISKVGGGTSINDYLDVVDSVADQANTFFYGANGSGTRTTNWAATYTASTSQVIIVD